MNQQSEKELKRALDRMDDGDLRLFDVYLHEIDISLKDYPEVLKAYGLGKHDLVKQLDKVNAVLDEVREYLNEYRNNQTVERMKGKW